MSFEGKKITDHPVELEREKVETWLEGFLPKLERSTTRTQKCRLLESVERMEFEYNEYAVWWDHVKFGKDWRRRSYGKILEKKKDLENFAVTDFQKTIFEEEKTLFGQKIRRSEIKQESGEWKMSTEFEANFISQGGEAIVLEESFDGLDVAVRVQVFDPFLFTKNLKREDISCEIHLSKGKIHFQVLSHLFYSDFEAAKEETEPITGSYSTIDTSIYERPHHNEDQIPFHKNVIRNYVNVEFFHAKDEKKEDCLGWLTIMEKADENLRKLFKEEKIDIESRRKIARGIWDGMDYLERCGIYHKDQKLEKFLLLRGEVKIIDFGLVDENTGRSGYRKMGYTRSGYKYKDSRALGKFLENFDLFQIF